jgi:hypothetical protein
MARGGKRSGAGRKPGSKNRRTKVRLEEVKAAATGVTPLEVMLAVMRKHYEAERFDAAAGIAKDAAPYVHPRLSAVQLDASFSDADADRALDARLRRLAGLSAGTGADAAGDPHGPDDHDAPGRNGAGPVAGEAAPE